MRETTDRSVADELQAAAIRDAAATLNELLARAGAAGLQIDVDVETTYHLGTRVTTQHVQVGVSRPL